MLITHVSDREISQWLKLAAELEPIFQGPMVNNPSFHQYMTRKIQNKEAFMAMNRSNHTVMGIISFSRTHNRISWFGVHAKYRQQGVGSKLLQCALNQLDHTKDISVTTFRGGCQDGEAARFLYQKFGFIDFDNTFVDGLPRCEMIIPADKSHKQRQSFHFKYRRYMDWTKEENCLICNQAPENEDYVEIAELKYSWVGTSKQRTLWGKCHVLSKKHYVELYDLPEQDLLNYMKDVQKAAKALKEVTGAVKINYEIHGNTVPHLHTHLFPRYLDDPFPGQAIDYNRHDLKPYANEAEFKCFVARMRALLYPIIKD